MSNPNDVDSQQEDISTAELLRKVLPACQPQEGSPATTFTLSELQELQAALSLKQLDVLRTKRESSSSLTVTDRLDICDPWKTPAQADTAEEPPQQAPETKSFTLPVPFRQAVRYGNFTGPTNGVCPGYLQCNLVVLPAGKAAFDFLLFCQRNSKACPLLEVCEGADSYRPTRLAQGVDLRTDLPKYAIYRNGRLDQHVTDCSAYWPENAVAFLIGCSFSYDGAFENAGIPLKSAKAGKNVPMYKTNIACEPAGSLHGNMVVSMKPIPCTMVAKGVEITSKYTHAHGGPVCVGGPSAIGISDITKPDWGEPIEIGQDEVPVFHACGVTPQAVLMESNIPFAITHAAGHMLVTDQPADMGVL